MKYMLDEVLGLLVGDTVEGISLKMVHCQEQDIVVCFSLPGGLTWMVLVLSGRSRRYRGIRGCVGQVRMAVR